MSFIFHYIKVQCEDEIIWVTMTRIWINCRSNNILPKLRVLFFFTVLSYITNILKLF